MNWIKTKLLLHVPLWVCGSLFLGALFLLESVPAGFIVTLFFSYLMFRYVWRKHLQKHGKLGDASSDLISDKLGWFNLAFWGAVVGIFLYVWLSPDLPELAVYANGTEPTGDNALHLGKHSGKRAFVHRLKNKLEEKLRADLACQYARQEKWLDDCAETKAYALDNKPETLEVLVLAGDPFTCNQADCRVWLIQIPPEQLAAYEAHREKDPDTELPEVQGTLITSWDQVVPPIRIGAENLSGWRKLQISHKNGDGEEWQVVEAKH